MPNQKSGGQTNTRILDEKTYQELIKEKPNRRPKPRFTKTSLRSVFGLILLIGYLVIIFTIVIADICCNGLQNASDLLVQVGILLSSPLSFVLGYYYNKDGNK